MAKHVTVQLLDDLDGSVIDDESGEKIEFTVKCIEYVIDLKAKKVNKFRKKFDHHVQHATRVGRRKRKPAPAIESAPTTLVRWPDVTQRRHGRSGKGRPIRDMRSSTSGEFRQPSKRRTLPPTELCRVAVEWERAPATVEERVSACRSRRWSALQCHV